MMESHMTEATCAFAATNGDLDLLKQLRQQECPWNEDTCASAAKAGHLHVLQWAIQNGCPCNAYTSFEAMEGGQLTVLKWLENNNRLYWDSRMCMSALKNGYIKIFKNHKDCDCIFHCLPESELLCWYQKDFCN